MWDSDEENSIPHFMVVPLHAEEDWLPMLNGLSPFDPGDAPVLFLSPHPDDESLAAGGLLAAQRARGKRVTLVAVTDGENAYADNAGLGHLRTREQTLAAARLGIANENILRLHMVDSGLNSELNALIERLLPHVSATTHIVAPWPHDFHPDHEACGRAALELARRTGARLTFYFFWTWHRGAPSLMKDFQLKSFALSPAQQKSKARAIAFHASQLQHKSGDPILHEIHLWPARLAFEVYLPA
ncbi:MAG TPA: PIG-L family deacetylase [Terracidiphilus sp.]|nr:PIG-L family deacetylase [Terracidiphilus sp.]